MILASAESILKSNTDIFSQSDFVTDFLRVIGWKGIKTLRSLAKGVESLFDAVYDFLNITNSGVFQNFYDQYRPLILVGFVVSLIALGMIYMLTEKRPEVLKNFIIGLLVIFATPTFIQYLNEAIFASKAYLASDLSSADSVISSNITDLLYLDSTGWDTKSGTSNSLDEDAISHLNPSEHVNKKNDVSSLGQQIFDTQIIVKADGKIKTGEMGVKGWGDIFDPPYYYRYSIHYFQIAILLIIFMLVIVFASYKTFLLIYEIMNSRIIGSLLAMDLTSGQKLKKVIEGFFSAYFSLFYILVSLKLYSITQAYINAQSYGPIVRTFMLLFAGFLVMDGPNLIEKIFGYDIGFGSGAQKFMSLMRLGMEGMQLKYYAQNMGLGGIGKGLSDMASSVNEKLSFSNSRKSDTPEPPTNPNAEEKSNYSAPEPNAASNNSQSYNSASTTDNQPKDIPNSSGNNGPSPNGENGSVDNNQSLNGENGSSYSTNEPPMSGLEQNSSNTESNEYTNDQSGFTANSADEIIPDSQKADSGEYSTADSNDLLNSTDSSLQEPGQESESEAAHGYDSQKISIDSDKESNAPTTNNPTQNYSSTNPDNGNESPGNTGNVSTSNTAEGSTSNSSSPNENNQPGNNYDQTGFSSNGHNAPKTENDGLSHPDDTNASMDNSEGVNAPEKNSSDIGKNGATNSTKDGGNSGNHQSGNEDSAKERLMDKKFGTESISPKIIAAPKDEPSSSPFINGGANSDLPGSGLQNNTPPSNAIHSDNSEEYSPNNSDPNKNNLSADGISQQDNVGTPAADQKENGFNSSINDNHSGNLPDRDNVGAYPADHKENDSNSSLNAAHSGNTDNANVRSADHKENGSNSIVGSLRPDGIESQSHIDAPTDQIVTPLNSGEYSTGSASQGSIGTPNEALQSGTATPHEVSMSDSSGLSEMDLKTSGALLSNNDNKNTVESGLNNSKNLNVADVLHTSNPELPKGDNPEKTDEIKKAEKKSTGARSKSVSKKK